MLYGNLARDGCVVKTAGVDETILTHTGRAVIFESEDDAYNGIVFGKVKAGDVVVIRNEGPKGGPGMQEMLAPTSDSRGWASAKVRPGHRRPVLGRHRGPLDRPRQPRGGRRRPDRPAPRRRHHRDRHPGPHDPPRVSDEELARRRQEQEAAGWKPAEARKRRVTTALRAYAAFATSAARGAVRVVPE